MIFNDKKLKIYFELEVCFFIEENIWKVRVDMEYDDKVLFKLWYNFRIILFYYYGGRLNSMGRFNFGYNGGYNNY